MQINRKERILDNGGARQHCPLVRGAIRHLVEMGRLTFARQHVDFG
jgi:hypothetical protein